MSGPPLSASYEQIAAHPRYQELLRKRNRFSGVLAVLTLLVFAAFIVFAMNREAFAAGISTGSAISWGMVISVVLIFFAQIVAGIYVWRANGEFDAISRALIKETSQ